MIPDKNAPNGIKKIYLEEKLYNIYKKRVKPMSENHKKQQQIIKMPGCPRCGYRLQDITPLDASIDILNRITTLVKDMVKMKEHETITFSHQGQDVTLKKIEQTKGV